jgi:hypothetical protein
MLVLTFFFLLSLSHTFLSALSLMMNNHIERKKKNNDISFSLGWMDGWVDGCIFVVAYHCIWEK